MKLKPLLISFSLLAFTGAAYAQQQQKEQMSEKDRQAQQSASGASASAQSQGGMTIDQVKDMEIVDAQGKDLGQIEDVVIDLSSGKVHAAVLSFGGFMGVGEKHYAFQPTELKRGKQKNQLVLNVDKQKLENAEGFEKGQWPGMDDEYWRNVGGKQAGAGAGGQSGQMNLIRASELEGKEVQDKSGNKVGEVQDVMIGLTEGQVRNIVVDVEGGGRATVPANSIKATGTEDRLVIDMDAQQLKQHAQRPGSQKQRGQSGAAGGTMGSEQTQGERPQPQGTAK